MKQMCRETAQKSAVGCRGSALTELANVNINTQKPFTGGSE